MRLAPYLIVCGKGELRREGGGEITLAEIRDAILVWIGLRAVEANDIVNAAAEEDAGCSREWVLLDAAELAGDTELRIWGRTLNGIATGGKGEN